jgi:GT2 family glycosyltransferase
MTNDLLLPVVIIYQEDYHNYNIYKSLLCKYDNMHVVLYDNSATPINETYSSPYLHYFHHPENGGVTAGANKGADYGASRLNFQYVVLFDQDTQFEGDYLEKLSVETGRNPYDLYAPVIKTKE